MPGRIVLGVPFRSITGQAAANAWSKTEIDQNSQIFVNSSIHETLNSFKTTDKESIMLNHAKTLRGTDIPKNDPELVIHTTYNQIINITHQDMSTFDYIVIDESHTLSSGLNYRSEVIADLIHHLVEFVAKKRSCKTKIIFMSGTPNVETHTIQELMEEFHIKSLFQRIIVDKEYKTTPLIRLTHLDTSDVTERQDTVISQINTYLKEGRKVCHILNKKVKMDKYIREIQTKLSSNIKIGLFYSGSEGKCTTNILNGKFGEYDVVLTTNYFINGINIHKDGITDEEFQKGIISPQKYGVIIDLGSDHTKVNAMDAIQVINRFRNRKCHSTILLPKIFKPDLKNSSRKFDYGHAGRVLLGINRYNYHYLSINKNAKPKTIEDISPEDKVLLLDQIKKDPLLVSTRDISAATIKEENRNSIIDKISKKARLYEDWFYSLDGYHYLAKDAGLVSIIMHKYIGEPFKKTLKDQTELENKLIRNFLDNQVALDYLENQLELDKRIFIKSSGVVTDPMSDKIGNFKVIDFINNKYVIEGDFHFSHERAINKLISCHLKLCFLYGSKKAVRILQFIIDSKADLLPVKDSRFLNNITKYINYCYAYRNPKLFKVVNYIKAIDNLSQKNLGIKKEVKPTYVSYVITNNELVQVLKDKWVEQQFDMIKYKIQTSQSQEKEELENYYSNKELIGKQDLGDLETKLSKLSEYTPLKYKSGFLKAHETIIIPRIIRSPQLLSPLDIEIRDFISPEISTNKENLDVLKKFFDKAIRNLDIHIPKSLQTKNNFFLRMYNTLKKKLADKDIEKTLEYVDVLINDSKTANHKGALLILSKIKVELSNVNDIILSAFKTAEYTTYRDLIIYGYIPFMQKTFFCEKGVELESLVDDLSVKVNSKNINDIYNSLFACSSLYTKSKRARVRVGSKRTTVSKSNSSLTCIKNSYLVLDKKGKILYSNFSLTKACKFLCEYAFNNERFVMKDGSVPIKEYNKRIYNPSTFKREYYANNSRSKTLANYSINCYNINIQDYIDYVEALKK